MVLYTGMIDMVGGASLSMTVAVAMKLLPGMYRNWSSLRSTVSVKAPLASYSASSVVGNPISFSVSPMAKLTSRLALRDVPGGLMRLASTPAPGNVRELLVGFSGSDDREMLTVPSEKSPDWVILTLTLIATSPEARVSLNAGVPPSINPPASRWTFTFWGFATHRLRTFDAALALPAASWAALASTLTTEAPWVLGSTFASQRVLWGCSWVAAILLNPESAPFATTTSCRMNAPTGSLNVNCTRNASPGGT